ncbi:cyclase family protein [Microbacterium esteraromaticum]|uniref:Cyclase family protein n=1 Tax=Microbacterium esteraromaticum TaxID=57043 RepID=A0A939DTS4_9MICO|nr:cyclase family protein [Microbacterium esteraromaticum]MBN8204854.1 cyclase family protein [Microbacterium esteraromaticum]MBN8415008.1 cyclase family protein [Microbacterium esteraromaticum]
MLHDLTHPITDGMMVYPGDPTVGIRPGLTLDRDGVVVERVQMGSHTGTHIDAPAHTILGGRTMADVTLDELVGDALILRVLTAQPNRPYTWDDLVVPGGIPDVVPSIVIIDTGWARYFGQQAALQHPHLDAETAAELWRRGMRLLAVDTLSPDETDATGAPTASFPVHEIVLGGDGLIVENIRGLTDLPARVRIGFFPLNLQGDGAPVRAVAFT